MTVAVDQIQLEKLLHQRDVLSSEIGQAKQAGEPIEALVKASQVLSRQIKELQDRDKVARTDHAELTCTEADTAEQVVELRQQWQTLQQSCPQASLFSTWEWISAWYSAYADRGQVRCLLVRDADWRLLGVAPLFLPAVGDSQLAAGQLGFAGTYGPAWGHYPEFLVAQGHEERVMAALLNHLCDAPRDWHSLRFVRMQPESPTLSLLMALAPSHGLRLYARPGLVSMIGPLPDDPTRVISSLASHTNRSHCRVALRELHERLPQSRFIIIDQWSEIEQRLEDLAQLNIMRHTVKHIESNFHDPAYRQCFQQSSRNFHESGWLRLHVLDLNGETLAATSSAIYGDCCYGLHTGFNPSHAHYRPSHLLALEMMTEAVTEGAKRLDMQTYYPYKAEICRTRKQLTDVVMFSDCVRGLLPVAREIMNRTLRTGTKAVLRRARAAAGQTRELLRPRAAGLVTCY